MRSLVVATLVGVVVVIPASASAQMGALKRLKDKAEQKVEQRAERRVDAAMEGALNTVECQATDQACVDAAAAEGRQPVDADGNTLSTKRPGEGAWTNYDFKPGERVLFADDLRGDAVGDFPRRMEFRGGQVEIVEWGGGRWMSSSNDGRFIIPLPEVLPERFTLEFDLTGGGNAMTIAFDDEESRGGRDTRIDINAHTGW